MTTVNNIDFITYIDQEILLSMKLGQAADQKRLTGLRNIKSEYIYTKEKNKGLSEGELVKKMHKVRNETAELYVGVNEDLRMQEILEINILTPFLPEELNWQDVVEFLNTLELTKEKKNFKKFQTEAENHFGQKVDSIVILDFIDGKISKS